MSASLRSFGIGLFVAGAVLGMVQLTSKESPDTQQSVKDTSTTATTVKTLEKENAALKKELTALEKKLKKQQQKQPAKKETAPATYTLQIETGMGTTEITNTLQKDGIISDAREFEQYIIDQGQATRLQNGSFTLQKNMSYAAILKALTN